jgi:6-phosphogluconolactonase (cycloisomerase 2 family)
MSTEVEVQGVRTRAGRAAVVLGAVVALAFVIAPDAHAATGDLTFAQCFDDGDSNPEAACVDTDGLDFANSVAVSPDGKSLYATSTGDMALVHFNRNPATGALTFSECFQDKSDAPNDEAACTDQVGLNEAEWVSVSPDGRSVYVASLTDDAIVNFDRSPTTGALSFSECFDDADLDDEPACTNTDGLDRAGAVASSADGRSLYVLGVDDDAIVNFDRDPTTGDLTFAECLQDKTDAPLDEVVCATQVGLNGAAAVAPSADGRSLYVASQFDDAVVNLDRDPTTGGLTFSECFQDKAEASNDEATCADQFGLDDAFGVAASADGRSVHVASFADDAVVDFDRAPATGDLGFSQCFDDNDTGTEAACAGADALNGPTSVASSADGRSLYVASLDDDAIGNFDRNTTTGALSFAECFDERDTNNETACANTDGLDGVEFVTTSVGGRSVYTAARTDDAIVNFNRATVGPPPPPGGGGGGGGAPPSNEFEIVKVKGKKLILEVPGPGEIEVRDAADQNNRALPAARRKRLKRSTATATAAGKVSVKLRLTRKAKLKLEQKGKVKVNAAITYTPTGGTANTQTERLKVKKKR